MTTVQEIESAVAHLPGSDLGEFRAWFVQFDAEAWDRAFEEDAQSGKLDRLADKALGIGLCAWATTTARSAFSRRRESSGTGSEPTRSTIT